MFWLESDLKDHLIPTSVMDRDFCVSLFSAVCWLPIWLAIPQPKSCNFYTNLICEVSMGSSPELGLS